MPDRSAATPCPACGATEVTGGVFCESYNDCARKPIAAQTSGANLDGPKVPTSNPAGPVTKVREARSGATPSRPSARLRILLSPLQGVETQKARPFGAGLRVSAWEA